MKIIYKIGEFAKKVNCNIQTLRYYDEINLLKPNDVDKFTLYRYYNENNIREYYVIILLKSMGFLLDEIRINKNNLADETFLKQREKLLNEIFETKNIIKLIDKVRSNIVDGVIKIDEFNYVIDNIQTKKIGKGEKNGKKSI